MVEVVDMVWLCGCICGVVVWVYRLCVVMWLCGGGCGEYGVVIMVVWW